MNRGIISISDELYKTAWSEIYVAMKDFRITHIEDRRWKDNCWHIYGVSDKFDEVPEGDEPLFYIVYFTRHSDGDLEYEFKKV